MVRSRQAWQQIQSKSASHAESFLFGDIGREILVIDAFDPAITESHDLRLRLRPSLQGSFVDGLVADGRPEGRIGEAASSRLEARRSRLDAG